MPQDTWHDMKKEWENKVIEFAKTYADASYLVSEENWPEEHERVALKQLVNFFYSELSRLKQDLKTQLLEQGPKDLKQIFDEPYFYDRGVDAFNLSNASWREIIEKL